MSQRIPWASRGWETIEKRRTEVTSQVCKVIGRTEIRSASADGTQLFSYIVVKDKKNGANTQAEKTEFKK